VIARLFTGLTRGEWAAFAGCLTAGTLIYAVAAGRRASLAGAT
jgi:hypothetical protein